MTRTLTSGMQGAVLRDNLALVAIVEIITDGGAVRAWNGRGDLDFNGETFQGVGTFGSISPANETLDLAAAGAQVTLSGIPSSLISSALSDMRQGQSVKAWAGIVKDFVLDNFIVNGFFDSDITSWTDNSTVDASISWNSLGYLDLNDTASGNSIADQTLSGLTIGQEYNVFWRTADIGAQGVDVTIGIAGGTEFLHITGQTQEIGKAQFTPTVTNPTVRLQAGGDSINDTASVDYISIIENKPTPLVEDPVLIFNGETDAVTILETGETATITVNVENRLLRLEKTNERRYTNQDQQRISTGDKGLEYVESLKERELTWGR